MLVSTDTFGLLNITFTVPLFVLMASILERAGVAGFLMQCLFYGKLRGEVMKLLHCVVLAAMSGVMGGNCNARISCFSF